MFDPRLEIFSTCPPSSGDVPGTYAGRVAQVAQWSERAGCKGILVYSDNSLLDAWLVSQRIVEATESLCPLVAVQPVYMHPYTVAKMVTTFASLHGRRVYLNLVAGGFKNDLEALGDTTPHDRRYERLVEYTTIIRQLLAGQKPVTLAGEHHQVERLRLTPPLAPDLFPGIFVSGSSEAGRAAARSLEATAIEYPKPAQDGPALPGEPGLERGIRVGLIANRSEDEAWALARTRFPEDRKGQLAHQLAMKVSDSVWHGQLSGMTEAAEGHPYWLVPFQNYKTMCPYLVGSHERVGAELARYLSAGCRTFILDVPRDPDDLDQTEAAFERALELCRNPSLIS